MKIPMMLESTRRAGFSFRVLQDRGWHVQAPICVASRIRRGARFRWRSPPSRRRSREARSVGRRTLGPPFVVLTLFQRGTLAQQRRRKRGTVTLPFCVTAAHRVLALLYGG